MGYVFSIFNLAYGLAEVPSGWLGDRWGQKLMMFRIVGGWSLFTMLTGLARGYPSLLAIRFAFGSMEAGAFPTLSRALSQWFPPDRRSRANGVMWTGARLGGALARPCRIHHRLDRLALDLRIVRNSGHRMVPRLDALVFGQPESNAASRTKDPVPWRLLLTNRTLLALFWAYFASGFGFQFFLSPGSRHSS